MSHSIILITNTTLNTALYDRFIVNAAPNATIVLTLPVIIGDGMTLSVIRVDTNYSSHVTIQRQSPAFINNTKTSVPLMPGNELTFVSEVNNWYVNIPALPAASTLPITFSTKGAAGGHAFASLVAATTIGWTDVGTFLFPGNATPPVSVDVLFTTTTANTWNFRLVRHDTSAVILQQTGVHSLTLSTLSIPSSSFAVPFPSGISTPVIIQVQPNTAVLTNQFDLFAVNVNFS